MEHILVLPFSNVVKGNLNDVENAIRFVYKSKTDWSKIILNFEHCRGFRTVSSYSYGFHSVFKYNEFFEPMTKWPVTILAAYDWTLISFLILDCVHSYI